MWLLATAVVDPNSSIAKIKERADRALRFDSLLVSIDLVVSTLKALNKPEERFVDGSRANSTNCEGERSSTVAAGPPSDYCYADCFAVLSGAEGRIGCLLVIDDKAFVASS